MALFKDKLNEIFGVGGPIEEPPKQAPVVELSPIDDFRNNIRARLNGIKDGAIGGCAPSKQELASGPATIAPIGQPPIQSDGILVERDNEIGLETLKGSIRKMGPQKVSEVIAKLSAEKNEVDEAGVATSEFDKFVDGLKQEAAEALLGSEATPTTPEATPEAGGEPGNTPEAGAAPKTPEQKLPDLVQTKL